MEISKVKELMFHYLTTADREKAKHDLDCHQEISEMIDGIINCARREILNDTQLKIELVEKIKFELIKKGDNICPNS